MMVRDFIIFNLYFFSLIKIGRQQTNFSDKCNLAILKLNSKKKKKKSKNVKFYWNIYTLITKPQQQGFYWNIDFDTSVCFMILAPKYIILAKIVGKRCMFQDSREKGREKVYV